MQALQLLKVGIVSLAASVSATTVARASGRHWYVSCGRNSLVVTLTDAENNPGLYDLNISGYEVDRELGASLKLSSSNSWTIKIAKDRCQVSPTQISCDFFSPFYPTEISLTHEGPRGEVSLERQTLDWLSLKIAKEPANGRLPTDVLITLRRDPSIPALARDLSFSSASCFWDMDP